MRADELVKVLNSYLFFLALNINEILCKFLDETMHDYEHVKEHASNQITHVGIAA